MIGYWEIDTSHKFCKKIVIDVIVRRELQQDFAQYICCGSVPFS